MADKLYEAAKVLTDEELECIGSHAGTHLDKCEFCHICWNTHIEQLVYSLRAARAEQAQREKAVALARAVLDKENWFPSLPCVQLQDMARAYLKAGGEGEDGR